MAVLLNNPWASKMWRWNLWWRQKGSYFGSDMYTCVLHVEIHLNIAKFQGAEVFISKGRYRYLSVRYKYLPVQLAEELGCHKCFSFYTPLTIISRSCDLATLLLFRTAAIICYCYHNWTCRPILTFPHLNVEVRFLLKTFFLGLYWDWS